MATTTAEINYTFSPQELEQLRPYGEVLFHEAGELLVAEGEREADCLVTLSGETHIIVESAEGPKRVGWMEAGQFAGDLSVLTGNASLARMVMGKAGEVLHIPYANFRRLLVESPRLSEVFVRTFTARRTFAISRRHASVILLGSAQDRAVVSLRVFLSRRSVPHNWLDTQTDPLARAVMAAKGLTGPDLPAVVLGASGVLRNATADALVRSLALDSLADGAEADLVVIGAGPAGLAACVYAASEGLNVIAFDAEGPGGQAGSSSKIENYLGFPAGVSGRELADRAAVQAQKFGVRIAAPARVTALEPLADGRYCLRAADGRAVAARAVVIATGAQYRRLDIPRLEAFEGNGVYYGASPVEAQLCVGASVAVVGAGNSAGQGAIFLAEVARELHVLYRRADIRETMSAYLVRRLEETPNVILHPGSELAELLDGGEPDGGERLGAIRIRTPRGLERLETPFVFLFIGALPFTAWLPPEVAVDEKGFVCTGQTLGHLALVRARWPLERLPSTFETTLPRVYAVGDVRAGSVKRVASAVGEGSVVVSDVHRALAELERQVQEAAGG
ncbi:FAD-dependent oxidoreductase [Spiribacter halobius]|uniref:Thioredoxin reductase n=1 Tax=Sediminicurvatus halobius TaxID=2182432 RepID=A0A2U2N395_9GAMM|nr:FAD-dependent oxidoreductase [Spiribacter halobius]PWG63537.1 thioredoxin reductase [Spiribacter halobius]UEX79584.1 FAD-dependent oxidoreductase [Spiribacter halobius]